MHAFLLQSKLNLGEVMQFKLLNFHKMLANFAVNIIAVFVPLILYTYTGNIMMSLLYLLLQYSLRITFVTLFRKQMERRPQLFLLIRIVPMFCYAASLLLLDVNLWIAVVCLLLFSGMSDAISGFSNEIILNYSSLNRGGRSFGLTRLFEQLGIIASVLAGGLFLDYLDKSVVIIMSITIYAISIIPLMYYYFKFRKNPDFNQEAISNAFLTYDQKQEKNKKLRHVSKRILNHYFIIYFLMCFIDALVNLFNLYMFSKLGAFTFASLVSASFNGAFGLSSYLVGKLNEKMDTTLMTTIGGIIIGCLVISLPFVQNEIVIIAMFAVMGGLYPLSSIFLIERMLSKTRILGISNQALFNRERANSLGRIGGISIAIAGSFLVAFTGIGLVFIVYSCLIPPFEERTRNILVRFLEGDD